MREHFNRARDAETDEAVGKFRNALGTLALPGILARVVQASLPAVGFAARELVKALHPESPGGIGLTRSEGRALVRGAADRFEQALLEEFLGDLRDDPDPERPEPKRLRDRKKKSDTEPDPGPSETGSEPTLE